jgi:hypothetical protein
MAIRVSTTGKLLGASIAAWVGAKLFSKYVESQEPDGSDDSVENPGMPDALHQGLLEAAWAGDKPKFLSLLDGGGCPKDMSTRRKFWAYYRKED